MRTCGSASAGARAAGGAESSTPATPRQRRAWRRVPQLPPRGLGTTCRREEPLLLGRASRAHLIRRFWEGSALLTSEQRGPLSDRTTSPFAPAVSQRAHCRDKRWRKFRSRHSELFGSSTFRSYEFCYGFPFITKISVAMLPRPTFEFEEASSVLCLEFFQL